MNLAGTKAVTVPQQEADLVQLMVEEAAKRGNEVSERTLECVDGTPAAHYSQ